MKIAKLPSLIMHDDRAPSPPPQQRSIPYGSCNDTRAMLTRVLLGLAAALLLPDGGEAYCNAMRGWPKRSTTAFPPGWNGLARTPFRGWRSWYAFYTDMDQAQIEDVITALAEKNRTVEGWEGKVSLCDLGYCAAGIDEGWGMHRARRPPCLFHTPPTAC